MKSQIVFTALLVPADTGASSNSKATSAQQGQVRRELRPLRVFPNPTNEGAWGHCEGDCDVDDECYHNLICFHRQEDEATPVPGCKGGDEDFSATDYCVFPGDIPLSGNLFEQHTGDHLNDEPTGLSDPAPTPTTTISAQDPDKDTATDPPLQLVQPSGASSLSQLIPMAAVSLISTVVVMVWQSS